MEKTCILCNNKNVTTCNECYDSYCKDCIVAQASSPATIYNNKIHILCNCNNITCSFNKTCSICSKPYNMITKNIAIGNKYSSYNNFGIIVNLNFPENGAKYKQIVEEQVNNKIIYKIGMYDRENEMLEEVLKIMIPNLLEKTRDCKRRILFHCYAGVSRSAIMAIAFISKYNNMTLYDSYKLTKKQRPCINPNYYFIKTLAETYTDNTMSIYLFNIFNAINAGNHKLVEVLVKNGADINQLNSSGETPLVVACDWPNIIEILLNANANPNIGKMKPLHVYTLYNNLNEQILDLFLKNGADINCIDMYGETPLHYAYMQGNKKIIDLLLKKGANMNIKNKQGKIPKHV